MSRNVIFFCSSDVPQEPLSNVITNIKLQFAPKFHIERRNRAPSGEKVDTTVASVQQE